ncbi:hypothetical protein EPIR_0807 [Erwinia piriflorinigrans CFBP 5888]|uniref:Uncharacterized protein n=1 Tax=Erwinia piriflorinigrans CFBP 5888 TaxID=1161919 RepID=V5Z5G3_9GAMM|nr:hypothetical protein EPIR_0807 [Erwinia piriflorinigrans CFBP 5888]
MPLPSISGGKYNRQGRYHRVIYPVVVSLLSLPFQPFLS